MYWETVLDGKGEEFISCWGDVFAACSCCAALPLSVAWVNPFLWSLVLWLTTTEWVCSNSNPHQNLLYCWAAADRSVARDAGWGCAWEHVVHCSLLQKHHCKRKSQVQWEHCAMEIPRSSLTQLAVINAVLKLRLAAVLGRNISPGRVKGGLEFWSLHCWVAAVCPVWEHHLPFWALLLSAQQTLLPPSSLLHLPMGKQFVFFRQLLISSSIRHFNALAYLCCFDAKIQRNCLCQCHTRIIKEMLNEYHLNYRMSTIFLQRCQLFSYFKIYIYTCIFWNFGTKIIKCSSFASITEETDTISLFSGYYSLLLCIEFNWILDI